MRTSYVVCFVRPVTGTLLGSTTVVPAGSVRGAVVDHGTVPFTRYS